MKYLLILFILLLSCSLFNSVNAQADMPSDSATIKDVDGNIYHTVIIGQQQWMAENLKTTRYNDGTPIACPGTDNSAWSKSLTGAYAWYNNDEATYRDTYGALYNWYAVNTGKLCPAGWHVPSDAEWTILVNHLGGGYKAGGKIKNVGTAHWNAPNIEAKNESGFSALPGGGRDFSGRFYEMGSLGRWGTSSEYDNRYVWGIGVFNSHSNVNRYVHLKEGGFSVRCVKNSQAVLQ